MASHLEIAMKKRLIVLLPLSMINDTGLAHVIHWEASRQDCDVLFLTFEEIGNSSLAVARNMVNMKSVTSSNCVNVSWINANPTDWIDQFLTIYRENDRVICLEGHTIEVGVSKMQVIDYLNGKLGIKIQSLPGFFVEMDGDRNMVIPEILKLAGFLAIVAIFTWFQYRTDLALDGIYQNLTIFLSFCFEIVLIWFWSNYKET